MRKPNGLFVSIFILLQLSFSTQLFSQNNVGIGRTPRAGYMLDVNGHLNVDGDLLLNSRRALRLDSTWNQSAGGNSSLGTGAGNALVTGSMANALFGFGAGGQLTGSENVMIGANAGYSAANATRNVFVGNGSGEKNTGTDNVFIGHRSGVDATAGNSNVFIGTGAAQKLQGNWNTIMGGYTAPVMQKGSNNVILGQYSAIALDSGELNVYIGSNVANSQRKGSYNVMIGFGAGNKDTTVGGWQTFLGHRAGYNNSAGRFNTFLGFETGFSNTTGGSNTFVGNVAGYSNTTGFSNSFMGRYAGANVITGARNTYQGYAAAFYDTAGSFNTIVGQWAGYSGSNYTGVTLLGDSSNASKANAVNATAIGYRAVAECDSCLVLGSVLGKNSAVSNVKVGIGTTNPASNLDVAGTVKLGRSGSELQNIIKTQASISIPVIAANGSTTYDIAVSGAETGSAVSVNLEGDAGNVITGNAYVNVAGNVRVKFLNISSAPSAGINTTAYVMVVK